MAIAGERRVSSACLSPNLDMNEWPKVRGGQGRLNGRNGSALGSSAAAAHDQNASFAGRPFNDSFCQNMPLDRRVIVWKHAP